MFIFKKTEDLRNFLQQKNNGTRDIGFVPTMGALHEGHLSLIRMSKSSNSLCICSIFVNPTQFNQAADLQKYPRTTSKDIALLAKVGCDVLFLPHESEIYPSDLDTKVEIAMNGLDTVMEGEFRPGHFAGVIQVVKRLLDITSPSHLYMGQKDFQQFSIIKHMIRTLDLPVNLVMAPTVRAENGLAKSSRNERLTAEQKEQAGIIYKTLSAAGDVLLRKSVDTIEADAIKTLSIPGFKPEYFDIVDGNTLQPVKDVLNTDWIVACTAVWAGDVRLIDNMILKDEG
ncbi:MAG: pantoate--beta-alanine ligase [Bacteroidetes bacterium]|nr:MAG: pantoate--beta-alanine ligase [Bacteroidota bacterium]